MNINTRNILAVGATLIILAGGFAYVRGTPAPENVHKEHHLIDVQLTIEGVLPSHSVTVAEGTTALGMLRAESGKQAFTLVEKKYAGLGSLVEQIVDFKNGTDGRYWTYSVNGHFAPIGADSYVLTSGDSIAWTFAVPENN